MKTWLKFFGFWCIIISVLYMVWWCWLSHKGRWYMEASQKHERNMSDVIEHFYKLLKLCNLTLTKELVCNVGKKRLHWGAAWYIRFGSNWSLAWQWKKSWLASEAKPEALSFGSYHVLSIAIKTAPKENDTSVFCRFSPFLLACYDSDREEFQSVCRVMSGFTDAFYKQV